MKPETDVPIALLIDGESMTPDSLQATIKAASKHGRAVIRRLYGSPDELQAWNGRLVEHGVTPCASLPCVPGRSAPEGALIIDAMDILRDGIVKGFVIASRDRDYTGLVRRVQEDAKFVVGIGEGPECPFGPACDVFVDVGTAKKNGTKRGAKKARAGRRKAKGITAEDVERLSVLIDAVVKPDGRAHLGTIGARLSKEDPAYLQRMGRDRLVNVFEQDLADQFEVVRTGKGPGGVFVRRRSAE